MGLSGLVKSNVIFVHGLWMTGIEMFPLRQRLRHLGHQVRSFHYSSIRMGLSEAAGHLNSYIGRISARVQSLHLVGHSLGGLVILKLFEDFPSQPPGRIVLLGPPYHGSKTAQRFCRIPCARYLLGRSMPPLLGRDIPRWSGNRDLGVIAGTLNIGPGRILGKTSRIGDGTIALEETRIPNARDFIALPVSHMGLVFSKGVAIQIDHFFKTGRFLRGPHMESRVTDLSHSR